MSAKLLKRSLKIVEGPLDNKEKTKKTKKKVHKLIEPVNKVEDNLQKLLELSKVNSTGKKTDMEKILKSVQKRPTRIEKEDKKRESVFTEADFKKFEAEYFCT